MALFPKIQSPCPYKGDPAAIMDGDMCRLCQRQVTDITSFSDAQRIAFFKACGGEVCVSYRVPLRVAAVTAALAAAVVSLPTAAAACEVNTEVIVMGGIKSPHSVQMMPVAIQAFSDKDVPVLPVVYDDKPAAKDDRPAPSAKPSSAP